MVQSFKFTFKILKNTKGFLASMVIMPIIMILLVSITFAYSNIPVVGYIGENAPNLAEVKMIKLTDNEKDYFLGLAQGTLVLKIAGNGEVEKYYSSIPNNPLIPIIENANENAATFNEKPKVNYSLGVILFKLLTAASLLATLLIQEKGNGIILRIKNSKIKLRSYIWGKSLAIIFIYEIANLGILVFYRLAGFDLGLSNIIQLGIIFTVALFVSTGLFILLSAFIKNEGQIWAVSTGIIFPLGVCSGMIFPIESMPNWMKAIAHISPLYYLQSTVVSGNLKLIPIFSMLGISLILGWLGIRLIEKRS